MLNHFSRDVIFYFGETKMKITLSKSQWEKIGKQAGWIKKSDRSIIGSLNDPDDIYIKDGKGVKITHDDGDVISAVVFVGDDKDIRNIIEYIRLESDSPMVRAYGKPGMSLARKIFDDYFKED